MQRVTIFFVSNASYLRLTKSETRDLADREYRARMIRHTSDDWQMSNNAFFTAFVVIAALVTVLALILALR